MNTRLWLIILLLGLAWSLRTPMEASMAVHMLVQLPLLAVLGGFLPVPRDIDRCLRQWDAQGIATLLAAIFCILCWMLPRSLDAAVSRAGVDAAKFACLMLGVGTALRWSWPRLPTLVRGVVWSQAISMAMVMGWLYLTAPVRVCLNYGLDQQRLAGYGFVVLSMALAIWLTVDLFVAGSAERGEDAKAL